MRPLGLFLVMLGAMALVYAGASALGDLLIPPTAPDPAARTMLIMITGGGGLFVTIGLSLMARAPSGR